MRNLIGYVAGAAFGIAFVATCGSMKGNGSIDMGGSSPFDIAGLDLNGYDFSGSGGMDIAGIDLTGYDFSGIDIASADAKGSGAGTDYTSGTRIKARVMTSTDGASEFYGFFDSMLNVNCYFIRAADDMARCLPNTGAGIGVFFSDSGCSTPLVYISAGSTNCGAAPAYATKGVTVATCSTVDGTPSTTQTHVYNVAGAFSGTAYTGSPGSCTAWTGTGYALYTVGSEVPASMFVAGSITIQ